MKAQGIKSERETIIRFDEEGATVSIWTASDVIFRRLLKRLGRAYLTEDGERHAVFEFPVEWLILPKSKVKRSLTEAQAANLRDRGLALSKNRAKINAD